MTDNGIVEASPEQLSKYKNRRIGSEIIDGIRFRFRSISEGERLKMIIHDDWSCKLIAHCVINERDERYMLEEEVIELDSVITAPLCQALYLHCGLNVVGEPIDMEGN